MRAYLKAMSPAGTVGLLVVGLAIACGGGEEAKRDIRELKSFKRGEQADKCAICGGSLPEKGSVLDRFNGMKPYTRENTRLLCPSCDRAVQKERGYH